MANNGYVKTKKKLSIDQIDKDVKDINNKYFNGVFKINKGELSDIECYWSVEVNTRIRFDIFLQRNRLIFRHPHDDWAFYAQVKFEDCLADRYNGKILDDGTGSKTWKAEPDRYPTYKDWVIKNNPKMGKFILMLIRHSIPQALRNL